MARWRLGVVLGIPDPVRGEIDGLRRALGSSSIERISPHVTLVPPVNVREDQLAEAMRVLRTAAHATAPFDVELGPAATFRPDSPTLMLSVDSGEVRALREAVFVAPLERTLSFPYVPHVTIAEEVSDTRTNAALQALADYRATVTVDALQLLRESDGRVWERIAEVPLGEPHVIGRGGFALTVEASRVVDPHTLATLQPSPDDEVNFVITLFDDHDPVGVLTARRDGGVLHLIDIAIAESVRTFEVDRRLLTETIDAARSGGIDVIFTRLDPTKQAEMSDLLQGHGFDDHGVRILGDFSERRPGKPGASGLH